MIELLHIKGYKSIEEEELKITPLTILTGLNSAGKSTLIQSILILASTYSVTSTSSIKELMKNYIEFNTNRNRFSNAKEIYINAKYTNNTESKVIFSNEYFNKDDENNSFLDFEENLFYISANRIGQEELASYDENIKFGTNGKYVFGFFEQNKSQIINEALIIPDADSHTLDSQVSYWLKYILDINLRINTELITTSNVKVTFSTDGLDNISPFNLGAGNSYLAKIIIIALSCNPGNIFIIENPEIHLHPKAQAMLADFLNFIASKGIQIIVETHSEHFINKTRFSIFKKRINKDDVIIHYKPSAKDKFLSLMINQSGHFINKSEENIDFPSGFFDSTLNELLEIM